MKLYYFEPHNYAATFHVMAESAPQALEYLKKYLRDEDDKDDFIIWHKATINNLPREYTIEEFEMGQVSEGEIA